MKSDEAELKAANRKLTERKAFIVEVPGGLNVKYGERYLYSSLNPRKGAERRADRIALSSGFIYIIASPLLFLWYCENKRETTRKVFTFFS